MLSRKSSPYLFLVLDTVIGALLCAIIASLLVLFTRGSDLRPIVPIVFICVIVLVSVRFSVLAATVGAVCATLLFAYFLFTPVGSFKVQKGEARNNLMWMLILGVPAGYFAWASKADGPSNDKRKNH